MFADLLTRHLVLKFLERLRDTDTDGDVVRPAEYEEEPPNFSESVELPRVVLGSTLFQGPVSYTPPGSPYKRVDVSTPRNVLAGGEDLRVSGFFPGGSSLSGGSRSSHSAGGADDEAGMGQSGMDQSDMGRYVMRHSGSGRLVGEPLDFEHFTGESLRLDFKEHREQQQHRERLLGLTPARPRRLRPKRAVRPWEEVSSSGDLGLLD